MVAVKRDAQLGQGSFLEGVGINYVVLLRLGRLLPVKIGKYLVSHAHEKTSRCSTNRQQGYPNV